MDIFYGDIYWNNMYEDLEAMSFEEDLQLNVEAAFRFLIFGTFFNSDGVCEFFKGGANVSQSS